MALYISTNNGNDNFVFDCIKEIVRCDPGYHVEWATSDSIDPLRIVRYSPQKPLTRSTTFFKAVNDHANSVVIYGVTSSFIVDPALYNKGTDGPPSGMLITQSGGGWTHYNPGNGSAAVVIDVDDAFGQHYRAPGTVGSVYDPLPTILFHELSHAYHYIMKDDNHQGDYRTKEVTARTDENMFRGDLHLPLLDVQNDSDPGFGMPTEGDLSFPPCEGTGWDCGCHIAAATLGSRIDHRIVAFGRAKRKFDTLTLSGVPLLEPMFSAYRLFSPMVAGDVRTEPALREAMRHFAIEPSVHLVELVDAHLSACGDTAALALEALRCIGEYLSGLPSTAVQSLDVASASARRASRVLSGQDTADLPLLPDDPAADIFTRIVVSIHSVGVERQGMAWLFDGLALFLDAAWRQSPGSELVSGLGRWFARVPIPGLVDASHIEQREVDALRRTLLHRAQDYDAFTRRLSATGTIPAHSTLDFPD